MHPPPTRSTRPFAAWMLAAAATMFLGVLAHTSIPIPFIDQPTIVPATIVETICGTALTLGAASLLANRSWKFTAAVVGHVVAIAGFLLGIINGIRNPAADTLLNWTYHRIMLAALMLGLLMLVLPRSRLMSHPPAG